MNNTSLKLLDCTIRDGGYLNDWDFPRSFVYRLLRVLDEAGFSYAEVGFWNPSKTGMPWKHCDIELLQSLDAGNLRIQLVLLIDYGSCSVESIPDELRNHVSLLRIATHKKDLPAAVEFASRLKQRGFGVTINCMGITNYSQHDLLALAAESCKAEEWCDYWYLADSFGSLAPAESARLFQFLRTVTGIPLGFHPHNNLELAVANTLAAIDSGVSIVDSSLLGIGRGGGNLRSEVIAAVLGRSGVYNLNPLPLLSFADATFDQIGSNLGLSYDLEQVISGMARCHPNYASALIGPKRMSLDEIYQVMVSIPDDLKGGFKEAVLDEILSKPSVRQSTATVVQNSCLRHTGETKALLLCPGAAFSQHQHDPAVAAFSVNYIPDLAQLRGAIFGSLRRVWQHGDKNGGIPLYLATEPSTLSCLPACLQLDVAAIDSKLKRKIHNSGIKAIALLLDAGFTEITVIGMKGFAGGSNGPTNGEILRSMHEEALVELQAVKSYFEPMGACIHLLDSGLNS